MAKFDPKTIMNSELANKFQIKEPKEDVPELQKIPYNLLVPHPDNTYDTSDYEGLADNIMVFGLMDPIIVKPIDSGRYLIIGGHRRLLAIKLLVEERGLTEFKDVPCHICNADESKTIERIRLHSTNFTAREMTEYDRLVQVTDLLEIIQQAKDNGEYGYQGKMRDILSNYIHLKEAQIQKYITIAKKASEETKEKLKNGAISFEQAYNDTKTRMLEDECLSVPETSRVFLTPQVNHRKKYYKDLEDDLTNALGTKVVITGKQQGTVSISYYSANELDKLFLTLRNTSNMVENPIKV